MTESRLTCWRSRDGGPWKEITVGARSIIGHWLIDAPVDAIYEDGYGSRYRSTSPDRTEKDR